MPTPNKPANGGGPAPADWTILIYMAGDNDLDSFGGKDINEMKTVGSSDKVHIIVQRDSAKKGAQATRMRVRKGTTIASDVVKPLGKINTGDPAALEDFLNWGLAAYPAKRTMAVLWNHGSGWDDTDIYEATRKKRSDLRQLPTASQIAGARRASAPPLALEVKRSVSNRKRTRSPFFLTGLHVENIGGQRRAICFDDDAQDFLDSVEMKNVFASVAKKAGRPFDVIGMDACLMAMVETALQVQVAGSYFVGSQEVEPGNGWPYDVILKELSARSSIDGKTFCALIARQFVRSYKSSETVTQSACDLKLLGDVVKTANVLGSVITANWGAAGSPIRRSVSFVREMSQHYEHPDYVDLWDFAGKLAVDQPQVAVAAKAVQKAIEACVFANHAMNPGVANSHGLSIYLPLQRSVSPLYKNLDFGKDGWARFINARAKL